MVLIATPDKLSVHTRWDGCDSVSDEECVVKQDGNRVVTATFKLRVAIGND